MCLHDAYPSAFSALGWFGTLSYGPYDLLKWQEVLSNQVKTLRDITSLVAYASITGGQASQIDTPSVFQD